MIRTVSAGVLFWGCGTGGHEAVGVLPGLSQYAVLVWGATVGQNSYDVCQVVENVNPNVANSSLNSSGFSENLPNLSLQIPTSPISRRHTL